MHIMLVIATFLAGFAAFIYRLESRKN